MENFSLDDAERKGLFEFNSVEEFLERLKNIIQTKNIGIQYLPDFLKGIEHVLKEMWGNNISLNSVTYLKTTTIILTYVNDDREEPYTIDLS